MGLLGNNSQSLTRLKAKYAESRAVLLEERDAARRDSRLKARFMSYQAELADSG